MPVKFALSKKEIGFLLIFFLSEFTRGAFFLTFLPLYAVNALSISIAITGVATSSHYLVETLCKGAAGWQLDKYGRPVLMWGLLLGLFSLLAMKAYPSIPMILLASAGLGLGFSPVWLGVLSEVAPVEKENRAERVGLVFTVWLTGSGSGPVLINFVLAYSYNLAFWILIIFWGLSLLPLLLIPSCKNTVVPKFSLKRELKHFISNPTISRILMPGMFIQTLAAGILFPVLPVFAQDRLGLNHSQYGLLLLTGGISAAISFLPMGRLANRLNLRALLSAGFGLTALALALFSGTHKATTAYFLAVILGLSYGAVLPAWNSLLAKAIPVDRQATGWGVFSTVEGLGIAIGPAIGGLVAKIMGTSAAIMVSTTVMFFMACFYFLYPYERFFARSKPLV